MSSNIFSRFVAGSDNHYFSDTSFVSVSIFPFLIVSFTARLKEGTMTVCCSVVILSVAIFAAELAPKGEQEVRIEVYKKSLLMHCSRQTKAECWKEGRANHNSRAISN